MKKSSFNLENKIVVITGGAGLIGKSFAEAVANSNGTPVIVDVDQGAMTKLARLIKKQHGSAGLAVARVNITSEGAIDKLIRRLDRQYGKIDALVNCAYPRNKNYGRKFEHVKYGDFCENINLHLGGYFLASQRFAEYFKGRGGGNIVNLGSIYGAAAPRFEIYKNTRMTMPVEYAAIKAAVVQLTKYMAKYYKGFNIRFNTLSPGGIYDDQPEEFVRAYQKASLTKGLLDRTDLNGALLFLLSDHSRYLNGQNIVVDDGFTL